jgi:hypothetical protein
MTLKNGAGPHHLLDDGPRNGWLPGATKSENNGNEAATQVAWSVDRCTIGCEIAAIAPFVFGEARR